MSVEAKITGRFDNNNVQVEIKSKNNGRVKYYEVPEKKADAFIVNYKNNDKRTSIITNTSFAGSIVGAVILSSMCTKKMKNSLWKWLINTAAGVFGAAASIVVSSDYIAKQNDKMLKTHQAREIDYSV